MIVIGAKGFAKELLEVLSSKKYNFNLDNLVFFDNLNKSKSGNLFGKYRIITSFDDCRSENFCLGIGNPQNRKLMSDKFKSLGMKLTTIISENSSIGSFNTFIGTGTTVIGNAQITNNVTIGEGCLVYMNTSITHDVIIGNYVEVSPGVTITGHCHIGNYTSLGAGSIVLPKITIGCNCTIGAGSVVTKNIPDNSLVVGIPGKIIKTLPPFE